MTRWDMFGARPKPVPAPLEIHQELAPGPYKTRKRTDYDFVHRLSLSKLPWGPIADHHLRAEDVIREFMAHPELNTRRRVPYNALVLADSSIVQILPLSAEGQHAGGYNYRSRAVAVVGLLDEHKMTHGQYASLIHVLASWRDMGPPAEIVGHTEQAPSKKYPNKRCPGRFVSMHSIRTQVECQPVTDFSGWSV